MDGEAGSSKERGAWQQQQEGGDDAEDAQTEQTQQLKRGQDLSWPCPISLLSRSSPACQDKHGKDATLIRAAGSKYNGFLVIRANKKGLPYACSMCRAESMAASPFPGREGAEMSL